MELFSYFEHCEGRNSDEEVRLIALWRAHHTALGFTPIVLSEHYARKHKEFEAYEAAIDQLTQKPGRGESRATFMRWLAMAVVAGGRGVLCQYNTFLYPDNWADLDMLLRPTGQDMRVLKVLQGGARASLVLGTEQTYQRQAERFATCQLTGAPIGVTDDRVLELQAMKLPETLECVRYVQDYGKDGWSKAGAVRYGRAEMARDGHGILWQSIPTVRKQQLPSYEGLQH